MGGLRCAPEDLYASKSLLYSFNRGMANVSLVAASAACPAPFLIGNNYPYVTGEAAGRLCSPSLLDQTVECCLPCPLTNAIYPDGKLSQLNSSIPVLPAAPATHSANFDRLQHGVDRRTVACRTSARLHNRTALILFVSTGTKNQPTLSDYMSNYGHLCARNGLCRSSGN